MSVPRLFFCRRDAAKDISAGFQLKIAYGFDYVRADA